MASADPEPLTDEAAAGIVSVLHRHGVRFIVIGGFAIQLHGVEGLARTSDIDVTPERGRDNLERLALALTDLDAGCGAIDFPTRDSLCLGTSTFLTGWTRPST